MILLVNAVEYVYIKNEFDCAFSRIFMDDT